MPWTASDADKFCKGLAPKAKERWATIANAALSACSARKGKDCEGYAVRIANVKAKGAVEGEDREWMRQHLGAALSEYTAAGASMSARQAVGQVDRSLMLSAARLFNLTEGELMEAGATRVVAIHERANFSESYDVIDLDEASGVLRNVKALGKSSLNGREYGPAALAQAAKFMENCPVFRDHAATGATRSSREHLGVLRNGHVTDDGVRADWYYSESVLPELRGAVRHRMPAIGLSISAKGKVRGQGDGRPALVEEISDITSTDFVAFPATVRSLAESVEQPGDGLAAAVEIDEALKEKESQVDEKVVEQLQALQAQVAALTEQVKAEGDARKKAEAEAARVRMVAEAVEESGKAVAAAVRKILEKCDSKDEMKAVLTEVARPAVVASKPMADTPVAPLAEGKDKDAAIRASVDSIFEAIGKDCIPGRKILEKVGR
jgi:hypothetical protein